MVAAGIEGSSKRRIEEEWSLQDYGAQLEYWVKYGPPVNVSLVIIAKSLGIDFAPAKDEKSAAEDAPLSGPSISELAALAEGKIARNGDTTKATSAVLGALMKGDGA